MNISDLTAEVDEKVLRLRRVRRILESEAFFAIEKTLDDSEREKLKQLIQAADDEGIKTLIKRQGETELGSKTLRQLRKMAKGKHIRHYHMLPKPILLSELMNAGIS